MALNHIDIMGRLVRDPELRQTNGGKPVASFTLAVDRDRKNQSGERETDFVDVTAWNNTAEFVSKYFAKGRLAVVSGRLQMRKWQDKDGNNRVSAEIVADSVYFGDSKKEAEEIATTPAESRNDMGGAAFPAASEPNFFPVMTDDDGELPF
jgi:single-strand DNA-binding protein